jgi:hypothetical protein
MNIRSATRPNRIATVAAALALLLALVAAPMASADTTGTITVTASITTELTLTLCDTGAEFGDGLTATGATPSNTTDAIGVTNPGGNSGEGVFYSWTPSCQVEETGDFWEVTSSMSWRLFPCATENDGVGASPTINLARSLRWDALSTPLSTYSDLNSGSAFGLCPTGNGFGYVSNPGTFSSPLHLFLRVDPSDQAGTFSSSVVWTLTPN